VGPDGGMKTAFGQDLFRLLVESVADYAIFLLDAEGRVQTWNRGAELIKGYRPDEVIGKHFALFYPLENPSASWRSRARSADSRTRVGDCARMAPASGATSSSPRYATRAGTCTGSPRSRAI
jgi:PAS domain-containing protein